MQSDVINTTEFWEHSAKTVHARDGTCWHAYLWLLMPL